MLPLLGLDEAGARAEPRPTLACPLHARVRRQRTPMLVCSSNLGRVGCLSDPDLQQPTLLIETEVGFSARDE
jgi:hypothetical protein